MSRFNRYFTSYFRGCAIVGKHRDEHRNRDVTVYGMNGEPAMCGIYDGVDTWVVPVETCSREVQKAMVQFNEGVPFEIEQGQTRLREKDAPGIMGKPSLTTLYKEKPRKSVKAEAPQLSSAPGATAVAYRALDKVLVEGFAKKERRSAR